MMRFSPNLKKVLLIGTIVLLGCDVSMLFAAQNNDPNAAMANENSPQLQQLDAQAQQAQQVQAQQAQQVQAQIQALQNQNQNQNQNTTTTTTTTTAAGQSPQSSIAPPAVTSDTSTNRN